MTRPRRVIACLAGAAAALLLLAACTGPDETPTAPPGGTTSASPSPMPTVPPEPVFDGTAEQNQAYFDMLNRELVAADGAKGGGSFIDNLVAHGYPRERMEVTPDTTAIGVAADNVVFSIRFGDSCLLGQWGNIGYTSMVAAVLSTGRCIVGTARPA